MHSLVHILNCNLHRIGVGVVALMAIVEKQLYDGIGTAAVVGFVLRHMAFFNTSTYSFIPHHLP